MNIIKTYKNVTGPNVLAVEETIDYMQFSPTRSITIQNNSNISLYISFEKDGDSFSIPAGGTWEQTFKVVPNIFANSKGNLNFTVVDVSI